MFTRYTALTVTVLLTCSTFTNADFVMARVDQNGDIIDGPVIIDDGCNGVCKVSDSGYIYYLSLLNTDIVAYDSSLNFVNSVYYYSWDLSIDNVHHEIINGHTIMRFGPTLNQLDYFEVDGNLRYLTADQADGSIWYTTSGLCKVAYDGTIIFDNISEYRGCFTDVSPTGSFWLNTHDPNMGNPRLFDSDGTYRAEANIYTRQILEMRFASEACWMITEPPGVAKADSSGTIVYNNSTDFNNPTDLAIDQSDGSVWIADRANYELVHLDASGNELLRKTNDWTPTVVAVDPSDSTVIVMYYEGESGIESASLGKIKASFADVEE